MDRCFFFAYLCPYRSLRSNRISKSTFHGRGQCKRMCSILDVDDVDVSELMWADVSSLLSFVLIGALDQTGLARSKRMHLITQGI